MDFSPEFRVLLAAKKIGELFPYFYPAITKLRFMPDNKNTETMSINCSLVIAYNEAFVKTLTDEELNGVIFHEILHYINGHHTRYMNNLLKDTLPYEIHNIAMDIEINEIIAMNSKKIIYTHSISLPEDLYIAKSFKFPKNKTYEEYLLLINKASDLDQIQKGKRKGKMPTKDLNMDGYNDDIKNVIKELIKECKEHEENIGTENDAYDINRKIKKRAYRWEQVFQNIISTKTTEIISGYKYKTFEKANRRYVHTPDIILPVFIDRKIKISLAIIMDISGSMYDITDKMYGVMKSMIDILDMEIDITILEVDTDVQNIMHGFDLSRETINSKAGGGTDMGAGLLYIWNNKLDPDLIVVMTDSETPWPDPPILADKTVVLTDNPSDYDGPYPMYPVIFSELKKIDGFL